MVSRRPQSIVTRYVIALLVLHAGLGIAVHAQDANITEIERRMRHRDAQTKEVGPLELPDGIALNNQLSEDSAVAIALWNNAVFHADLAGLGIARADLLEAGFLRNPLFSLLLPLGYRQLETVVTFPLEAIWQRPRRVRVAELELERVTRSLEQNALNLVRDVKLAYSDLILAKERAQLADETVQLRRKILRLTEVRLRVGDISALEANITRQDNNLAMEQAARAQHDVALARVRLGALMGIEDRPVTFDVKPVGSDSRAIIPVGLPAQPVTLEPLLEMAFTARPDLRAAEMGVMAAARRAKWERSRLMTLAGLFSFKRGAGLGASPRPGFLAELPIFNRNQGGISRADAEVERAAWTYLTIRQRIALEVQEAYRQLLQAREALEMGRRQIQSQAEEDVRLAERSYREGNDSLLIVLEATRRLYDARAREIEIQSDLRRAVVQLERSIGKKYEGKP